MTENLRGILLMCASMAAFTINDTFMKSVTQTLPLYQTIGLRGLIAVGRGIPRPGMGVTLVPDVPLCDITSGTFSPTLKTGIGLALVPTFVHPEAELGVDVRGRREIFRCVKLPFVDTSVRES